ncbi:MAG: phosphoribosylanthranilate isomerase [Selenomonadaceae bacterium]|nr:phosphoribosylanthranilate isomerase [Selenomonadaceae bacterium]
MLIKICGIRDIDAARAAEEAGADFIGFILSHGFRRTVEPEAAAEICRSIRRVKKVGVFVDEPAEYVNEAARLCGLDYVQLHGHETPEYAAAIKYPIIKAMRYGDDFTAEAANSYPADMLLVDSFANGKVGGSGQAFAWQEAAAETKKLTKPFFIAGGISKENAREAIEVFNPNGLDASGSLEDEAGNKSPEKIREYIESLSDK